MTVARTGTVNKNLNRPKDGEFSLLKAVPEIFRCQCDIVCETTFVPGQ